MALDPTQRERPTEQEASPGVSVASGAAPDTEPRSPGPPRKERIAALEAEIATLEAELEKRDEELEQVVERYEALLDEQVRARRAAASADGFVWSGETAEERGGLLAALRSLF